MILEALGALGSIGSTIGDVWTNIKNNRLSDQNYKNQLAQQDYEKAMQRESWNREDTAVQRRVADLKAAGLNPVLAAGSAAQSQAPIKVGTPEQTPKSYKFQSKAPEVFLDLIRQKADISKSVEENKLIKLQQKSVTADTIKKLLDSEKERWNLDISKKNNMPTAENLDPFSKASSAWANVLSGFVDKVRKHFKKR